MNYFLYDLFTMYHHYGLSVCNKTIWFDIYIFVFVQKILSLWHQKSLLNKVTSIYVFVKIGTLNPEVNRLKPRSKQS